MTPQTLQSEFIARNAWKQGVIGSLNVVTAVLAVRAILLIAVCGAFSLALLALNGADMYRLGVLTIYCVVVLVPLVVLSLYRG